MRFPHASRSFNQRSSRWAGPAILAALGLVMTVTAGLMVLVPPHLIRHLNLKVYDLFLLERPPATPSAVPVLVLVDDASLSGYGQWPWPRYRLAQLVAQLDRLGVEAIVLDMLLAESDRTSLEVIARERARDLKEPLAWALPPGSPVRSNDQVLADAFGQVPVIVGYKFLFSQPSQDQTGQAVLPLQGLVVQQERGVEVHWPEPKGVLANLPLLAGAAKSSGFTNAATDEDGVLRRVPLLMRNAQGFYPSLALAAVLQTSADKHIRLTVKAEQAFVHWNGRVVPLDGQGNLLLAFRGTSPTYPSFSATQVLTGALAENALKGRVALVGASAAGLGDRHATPVDREFPGMEVHAVVMDSLLSGDFLQEPPWARGAELFFVIFIGLVATLLLSRFGFWVTLLLTGSGATLIVGGTYALFMSAGLYLSPVMPLLLLVAITGLLGLVKYGLEVRKVHLRTRELASAQETTILGMTALAESRDAETGAHILRTQRYVQVLAKQLSHEKNYRAVINDNYIELLFKSAPLHDIGKVGIPDVILCKPGKLTAEEFQVMKRHPLIGAEALAQARKNGGLASNADYLDYAYQLVSSHHEKWGRDRISLWVKGP